MAVGFAVGLVAAALYSAAHYYWFLARARFVSVGQVGWSVFCHATWIASSFAMLVTLPTLGVLAAYGVCS